MIGDTFSHYRIVAPLGHGGMGVVYAAEDTRLGRKVAIKLLADPAGSDAQTVQRFLREAQIVSSLSHPHICVLYDIGVHEERPFIVMELLEGESLKERLARGPLPLADTLDLGMQTADALEAAHAQRVIHRDIKPANLFVTHRGQTKVLDFGVATFAAHEALDEHSSAAAPTRDRLTSEGSTVGTLGYMSPEQARGETLDNRSDLFSLGVLLYEAVSGRPPFPGATPAVIYEGILTKAVGPVSSFIPDVPPELDRILAKALEKDRDTRYQTAGELHADLRQLKRAIEGGQTIDMPRGPAQRDGRTRGRGGLETPVCAPQRHRRALLVTAPLAIVGIVVSLVLWASTRTPALIARDPVVLAPLVNRTGESVFDDTLGEALAIQLRQSPFLNVLAEQQVQSTLRLMGQQGTAAVTSVVASEVCQRARAKALLGGSIAAIGKTYVLTLRAQSCGGDKIFAEEQVQANGKEEVITALGQAASRFRERLGESLASVQRYDVDIEEATTRSLEALKAYSQATAIRRTEGDFASIPLFRQAIVLDPEFALAHARLGVVLSNNGQRAEAEQSTTRAYDLRAEVSDRERLYIEARYHTVVTKESTKAIDAYQVLIATYPDDFSAQTNLGLLYRNLGMRREAIASLEQSVRLAPGQMLGQLNLGYAYLEDGRLADAKRAFEQALSLQDTVGPRNALFVIATLTGDRDAAAAQVNAVRGSREETDMLGLQALAAGYRGRMSEAERITNDLFRRVQGSNRRDTSAELFAALALHQAIVGHEQKARRELERLRQNNMLGDDVAGKLVALGALLGDRRLAESNLERATQHSRKSTAPEDAEGSKQTLLALTALAAGRHQEAYDVAVSLGSGRTEREAVFVAGLAALRMQHWENAVRHLDEFMSLRSHTDLTPDVGAVAVMLGRAHAGAGRPSEARKAYEKAFAVWEDADSDLPILVAAKEEYAKLQRGM